MARATIIGFNKAVVAGTGSLVGTQQQLMVQVDGANKKLLKHIEVSFNADVFASAFNSRIARLIVCKGSIPAEDLSTTILSLNPFNTLISIQGIGQILLDRSIRDSYSVDFVDPIIVNGGETLNVILGLSWAAADTLLTPSTAIAYLSTEGEERPADGTPTFNYYLR